MRSIRSTRRFSFETVISSTMTRHDSRDLHFDRVNLRGPAFIFLTLLRMFRATGASLLLSRITRSIPRPVPTNARSL